MFLLGKQVLWCIYIGLQPVKQKWSFFLLKFYKIFEMEIFFPLPTYPKLLQS